MAWFRVRLTGKSNASSTRTVLSPNLRIREKMLVLLFHNGSRVSKQPRLSESVGPRPAVCGRVSAGGLEACAWNLSRPVSEMAAYRELIRTPSRSNQPRPSPSVRTIFQLTGLRRGPSQVASSSRIWA